MTSTLLPIIPAVDDVLFNFAQSDGFWANLATAFGTSYDVVKATQLRQQWQSRNFSQLPPIEVLSGEVLGTAKGAYAVSTNKIYLSESFLNVASSESLVKVILEEIGHYVDAQINQVDTPGDEGEYFAKVVLNQPLTEAEITRLKTENDQAVVVIDGQSVQIEQAVTFSTIVPLNYTATPGQGQTQGGAYNYFDDTNNQLIDGILGVNDWTANLGNGAAYEWVGWLNVNPTLNFNFGNSVNISQVQIGFSRAELDGIYLPDIININGSNFTLVGNEIANNSRGFLNFNGNFTGSNLSISLIDPNTQWIFIDEIKFVGNDSPTVSLAVSPSSVTEDGTTNLVYTFTRSGVTSNALTVNYTVGGTATNGTDYTSIPTSVTFAANSSTATVTVDPTADTTVESDETVILTLASGTGYTVGNPNAATGTITNDDTSVTLAVSPSSVTEDGTTNLVYTFTRTGVTTNALTVNYTIGGTATNGTDYTSIPTSVTFAANSATATVTVDPTADTTVESDETVILTLATGTGYTVGTTTAVTGTITNDDFSQLSINDITVVEGKDNNAILTVTVNNPNPQPITFNYTTAPIDATANVDYTSKTGTITIAPNTSTATISIPILNDNLNEADGLFWFSCVNFCYELKQANSFSRRC